MNKKGVDLTINTIIIAVLVVLVLIVLTTFFLGGFGRVTDVITRVFFPITAGTDQAVAVQTCEQRCEQAKLLPTDLRKNSAYCISYFTIDGNGNGLADRVDEDDNNKAKPFKKFYCLATSPGTNDEVSLGVSCQTDAGPLLC